MCPQQNSYVERPNVIVFGGGDFRKYLDHKSGVLIMGSMSLKEEAESQLSLPLPGKDRREDSCLQTYYCWLNNMITVCNRQYLGKAKTEYYAVCKNI